VKRLGWPWESSHLSTGSFADDEVNSHASKAKRTENEVGIDNERSLGDHRGHFRGHGEEPAEQSKKAQQLDCRDG